MFKSITDLLMQWLNSKQGALVQWVAGAAIGFLVAQAAKHSITIPPDLVADLEKWMSLGGAALFSYVMQWYQSHQTQEVQKIVGATPDGWIGKETIEAAIRKRK